MVELMSNGRLLTTDEVVARLRAALKEVGVALPSLGVDPVSGASDEPFALVVLGRCNVRTATRLAAVLEGLAVGDDEGA
ncbi:hypothetical protein ACOT81_26040 [Streptomyces sp. WI04-05B]|uniref:hypothetical protein n=1 Tax=Streptomyces TaxID=1883 RepID=UPI0029B27A1F|nr:MULTISPECIES: hypothetical protein [unclassified Streptomyces]MDX2544956.1 hypothetical protein [Streptomyces sp. WI04-05B]MDX2589004.1 hypothetical protein [Streptomyces sp. WI04-05A]MDX3750857.1 hypothetical protein [Streptomyces sp. AK08-02]